MRTGRLSRHKSNTEEKLRDSEQLPLHGRSTDGLLFERCTLQEHRDTCRAEDHNDSKCLELSTLRGMDPRQTSTLPVVRNTPGCETKNAQIGPVRTKPSVAEHRCCYSASYTACKLFVLNARVISRSQSGRQACASRQHWHDPAGVEMQLAA
ncbi:hypothetical protein SVAN01_04275 [Stagonosporopsis vannaccii]|nr:hypothetical protein SVAN01_04275 [Stagonosporopsis vannaccii]